MRAIHSFFIILLTAGALGCATTPTYEQSAANAWKADIAKWSVTDTLSSGSVTALSPAASLEECLDYAYRHNPGLQAARARWKAALERIPQARAMPDPRLTLAWFINKVETRTGPQRFNVALQQTIPWFGKLDLKGRIALQEALTEAARYEAQRRALAYRVNLLHTEYYYLSRAADIVEQNVQLLSTLEGVALSEIKAAIGKHAAVSRAQLERGKLQDRLASLRDRRTPLVAQINAALNRPTTAPLDAPTTLPAIARAPTGPELSQRLPAVNPELGALIMQVGKAQLAVQLAGKQGYPDPTIGLQYINTEAAHGSMRQRDSGKDPIAATLGINLPLNRRKYRAAVHEAVAILEAAQKQHAAKLNLLRAELETALFGRRDAERKIELYRDTLLPIAGQAQNITQQAFVTDQATFLDVIDTQRVMLEFQLNFERAQTDRAQRSAEIDMLAGAEEGAER